MSGNALAASVAIAIALRSSGPIKRNSEKEFSCAIWTKGRSNVAGSNDGQTHSVTVSFLRRTRAPARKRASLSADYLWIH
jgi:hypothetical protein